MTKLEQLLKQQQDITATIEAEKNKGRDDALATVRVLFKQYGITMREDKAYVLDRKPLAGKEGVALAKKCVVRKTALKRVRSAKK